MKVKQIFEVDLDDIDKDCLTLCVLTRKGVWVKLASIEITDSMVECYGMPLMLRFGNISDIQTT